MTDLDDEQLLTALWRAYARRLPDDIRATNRDLLDAILAERERPRAEQILPPAPPRIAIGEPIDPATAPACCPQRFTTGSCRCCADVARLRSLLAEALTMAEDHVNDILWIDLDRIAAIRREAGIT